jgi:lipoate-protein ligase A
MRSGFTVTEGYRINQNKRDQTAGIVYQIAEEAAEAGETSSFSIHHYEDEHINLGRGLEELAEVPSELQFRRPGGGGYVHHEDTYCFGRAIPKEAPKEGIKAARNQLGFDIEDILQKQFDREVEYKPGEGDIYVEDSQVAGIGVADMYEDFGPVTVVRACMYPEEPGGELYQHGDLGSRVQSLNDFESICSRLEEGFTELDASEFVTSSNRRRARELQGKKGFREPEPCF